MRIVELEDGEGAPPELELISDDDEEDPGQAEDENMAYVRVGPAPAVTEPTAVGPFIISKVIDGLYLGSYAAVQLGVLAEFHITHVVGIGLNLPISLNKDSTIPKKITKTAAAAGGQYEYASEGVEYMCLEVEDSPDTALLNYMHGCFAFINAALKVQGEHHQVLLVCEEGKSASVAVLASYMMAVRKMSLSASMGRIKEANPAADPNKGFARHLRFLERNGGELPCWACP